MAARYPREAPRLVGSQTAQGIVGQLVTPRATGAALPRALRLPLLLGRHPVMESEACGGLTRSDGQLDALILAAELAHKGAQPRHLLTQLGDPVMELRPLGAVVFTLQLQAGQAPRMRPGLPLLRPGKPHTAR